MTMEHNGATCDKKLVPKAKSCNAPPLRLRSERRPFGLNEAVRSLDLALGRLKKPRMDPDYSGTSLRPISVRRGVTMADMFMDTTDSSTNYTHTDNASLVSINFSHYELMRNLSRSNCNSEGTVSGSASTFGPIDRSMKDEHLERYFRSVELWSRRCRDGHSNIRLDLPEN